MSNDADKPRKALGKGLSALLPTRQLPETPPSALHSSGYAAAVADRDAREHSAPSQLPIDAIQPNPVQPRSVFQSDKIEELAASIRANGIIQPLIVRHHDNAYQLIAGERRWRAAKVAGLTHVPVVVLEVADRAMLELALIENIQREDLNPIETAHAYERLIRELDLSQEAVALRTGKDRTSITNTLRLLKLPPEVQLLLAEKKLSMGHARAVLGLSTAEQQIEIAEKTAAQGLSVRQVEALVRDLTEERPHHSHDSEKDHKQDPNVRAAVEELERTLGTRVRITELSEQRGRIEIEYYSQAELDRLFQHITGRA